jgi:hypothetical protein
MAPSARQLNRQSGVTILEFALILPVLLLLIMGIIEFSMIMFVSSVIESATTSTARLGKTGYVPSDSNRQQEILDNITSRSAGLLDPAKITISTTVYPSFNSVNQPEPCISPPTPPCPGTPGVNFTDINGNGQWDADMGAAGLGNAGDVVVYTVNYPWSIMTPIMSSIIGPVFPITARTVVRNEPFS